MGLPAKGSVLCKEHDGVPYLEISGYLEEEAAGRLVDIIQQWLAEGRVTVVIDLGSCPVVNSIAIGRLHEIAERITEDFRGRMIMCRPTPLMERAFKLAGLTEVVSLVRTLEEALLLART